MDVYVKNSHCERSIQDLNRYAEAEITDSILKKEVYQPDVRMTLGHWQFLQKDLIPLLIFHKEDKELAFETLKLVVRLTEIPQTVSEIKNEYGKLKFSWIHKKSSFRQPMLEILRSYKEAFLHPQVI